MKQTSPHATDFQDNERQTLEQLWNAGHLQRHLDALESFYKNKRQDFRKHLKENTNKGELLEVAKFLLVENGVVDQKAEAHDQIEAIESEIWIQGERGNYDRERIATDWAEHYARDWREWRVKEYLYTVERMESTRLADCVQLAS